MNSSAVARTEPTMPSFEPPTSCHSSRGHLEEAIDPVRGGQSAEQLDVERPPAEERCRPTPGRSVEQQSEHLAPHCVSYTSKPEHDAGDEWRTAGRCSGGELLRSMWWPIRSTRGTDGRPDAVRSTTAAHQPGHLLRRGGEIGVGRRPTTVAPVRERGEQALAHCLCLAAVAWRSAWTCTPGRGRGDVGPATRRVPSREPSSTSEHVAAGGLRSAPRRSTSCSAVGLVVAGDDDDAAWRGHGRRSLIAMAGTRPTR